MKIVLVLLLVSF